MDALAPLEAADSFTARHIGPDETEIASMLRTVGAASLDELAARTVPSAILDRAPLPVPQAADEAGVLGELRELAEMNQPRRSLIGQGYCGTHVPPVIQRNILESPGWYTAYTPYQAEISQGRLEALLNFQTMVCELTAMPLANASLLDEATAAAEGVAMAHAVGKTGSDTVAVCDDVHPQTLAVLQTRAHALGWTVRVVRPGAIANDVFALVLQYPGTSGAVRDLRPEIAAARAAGALAIVATDLLALMLLTPPGEMGADVVVGSAQRFGVPMGFGGPHAGFFATRDAHRRQMPGRLVGVSQDASGAPAMRLALQTREQHIRREKATSNICTAQVLLAVMAGMYAVWHGPAGLNRIARRVNLMARMLAATPGLRLRHHDFFDTIAFDCDDAGSLMARADQAGFNLRRLDPTGIAIALDETVTREELSRLRGLLLAVAAGAGQTDNVVAGLVPAIHADGSAPGHEAGSVVDRHPQTFEPNRVDAQDEPGHDDGRLPGSPAPSIPAPLARTQDVLRQRVFHAHRSEHEMLRYLKRLEDRDIALNRCMIPLGSCTMKLNASAEMMPVTWPRFADIHPFAPAAQTRGYAALIERLSAWLCAITGFAAVSLQPNAGSQGELSGLLTIRAYHAARGQAHRDVCLIPSSAHGTNPASAVMAGLRVVIVGCGADGDVDLDDLRAKAALHRDRLAALMLTYPSTHGVFEEHVAELCAAVHEHGGQVYMDGANMNAQVGLTSPARIGADVCHLNLHKTFCIPHGGGGPGVGPIGVAAHLAPHLPNHPGRADAGPASGFGPVSAAPFGSALILPISYAYIRMMGPAGLRRATEVAILNANYVAARLRGHYEVLYAGRGGQVAHECIVDCRPFVAEAGVQVEDIAKRLQDYGFHAPTMSWPVAGTLMIEPTESETQAEIDRFCDAMIAIRAEIAAIGEGRLDRADNPLKHAPHTAAEVTADVWSHAYTRAQAAYPLPWVRGAKYWPPVKRVDNVYGDRNLQCTCAPLEAYAQAAE